MRIPNYKIYHSSKKFDICTDMYALLNPRFIKKKQLNRWSAWKKLQSNGLKRSLNESKFFSSTTCCGQVMFLFVSASHSVCPQDGGERVTMWPLPWPVHLNINKPLIRLLQISSTEEVSSKFCIVLTFSSPVWRMEPTDWLNLYIISLSGTIERTFRYECLPLFKLQVLRHNPQIIWNGNK